MSNTTDIAITGANGRMGKRLTALATQSPEFKVAAALLRKGHEQIGVDAGEVAGIGNIGVAMTDELHEHVDAVIDFSSPAGMRHWLRVAHQLRIPIVIGTTGLEDVDQKLIDEAALNIPILQATNTSLGVAVLNTLCGMAAKLLGSDYDIEIVETHHRYKKDAPSGTALTLADHILKATSKTRADLAYGRVGAAALRDKGSVGVHSVRMGDVTGTHSAHFSTEGDRIEITHVASSRDVFARGALRAAQWIAGKGAGRYRIEDVLGLGGKP
jgi:4-hydroxy-tetrahydrodipicolinate reductase